MKNSVLFKTSNTIAPRVIKSTNKLAKLENMVSIKIKKRLPEVLFISSHPPRECGIATYSKDLMHALTNKFKNSFTIKTCALESESEQHVYNDPVEYVLNTDQADSFRDLAKNINNNSSIEMVLIQHEFGLFRKNEAEFITFLKTVQQPVIVVFHTVLPGPNMDLKQNVKEISAYTQAIIVMTNSAKSILIKEYGIDSDKITIISHGTHLVNHYDKNVLKEKYKLSGKKVLSTFGLLSSGKNIEVTLEALPAIIKKNKDVLFLIIGKTHPSVVKEEGEKYRNMLEAKIDELELHNHVKFINRFVSLSDLLEYLQLTDIYLFTSKDPNQAVSGTFSYAMSCGCPIVSTPIPHAIEVLQDKSGMIFDFGNSLQLSKAVNKLLGNDELRKTISANALHKIAPTAWENVAIAHGKLFEKTSTEKLSLHYRIPEVNLDHIKKMTTSFGMIQFSNINQPDIDSGYTLDDNARALVSMCQHFELTNDESDLEYIQLYFDFIKFCLQPEGNFLNYVDESKLFTEQNYTTNLEDSNGRAIWALGYLISISDLLPKALADSAEKTMKAALQNAEEIHSTRAMAFMVKGLYYNHTINKDDDNKALIKVLANRLVQMYKHEADEKWVWFESYLTYGNSILPEALLCAWLATGDITYKEIAKASFDFLLSKIYVEDRIQVISNQGWLHKENQDVPIRIGGEQPIDVAYTILALSKFYNAFNDEKYLKKLEIAFSWFLGNNHLNQIIYNPCTGGCYDGLEDTYINLNQGAESTDSYLMARLVVEKLAKKIHKISNSKNKRVKYYLNLHTKNQFA